MNASYHRWKRYDNVAKCNVCWRCGARRYYEGGYWYSKAPHDARTRNRADVPCEWNVPPVRIWGKFKNSLPL